MEILTALPYLAAATLGAWCVLMLVAAVADEIGRMNDWIETSDRVPPKGVVVETKIDDVKGVRNEQQLKREGRLYFFPDGSMYVYYTPTHWRAIPAKGEAT